MARAGTALPFDIAPINTVWVDISSLRAAQDTKVELTAHFKAVEDQHASFENPLSRYQNRQELKERGDPMAKELLALRETQEKLSHLVSAMTSRWDHAYPVVAMVQPGGSFDIPTGYHLEMQAFTLPANISSPIGGTPDSTVQVPMLVKDSEG